MPAGTILPVEERLLQLFDELAIERALFLIVLPRVYGLSTLGRLADLALFAVPFVLATSFMGPAAGSLFSHPEKAVRVFVATIVQQFFLVVVSWPREGGLAVPVAPHHGRPGGACGASTDFA